MARRSCALIGKGCGPKIRTAGRRGAVRTSGMLAGETFILRRFLGETVEEVEAHVSVDDVLLFDECDYVQVEFGGDRKDVIFAVHMEH